MKLWELDNLSRRLSVIPILQGTELLNLVDSREVWDLSTIERLPRDLMSAYQLALDLGSIRLSRGEKLIGAKIGFTNRAVWPKLNISAPIWGSVWDSTFFRLSSNGVSAARISSLCQPRIEPEIVFRLKAPVCASMSRQEIFECIETIAPAFEIVQCHSVDWKLSAELGVTDVGLHGQLWVGEEFPLRALSPSLYDLEHNLSSASVYMSCNEEESYSGYGSNVMENPFNSLCEFLSLLEVYGVELSLSNGFLISTGSWTEAPKIDLGEEWRAYFSIFDRSIKLSITG